jgi:hypothetical protein
MKQIEPNLKFKITNLQFTMAFSQPNPASTWVAFDYKLPIPATKGVLLITDMSGKAIASFNLNMPQGQQVWDTRGVEKGTFLYVLKAGNASKQGKIIIQ